MMTQVESDDTHHLALSQSTEAQQWWGIVQDHCDIFFETIYRVNHTFTAEEFATTLILLQMAYAKVSMTSYPFALQPVRQKLLVALNNVNKALIAAINGNAVSANRRMTRARGHLYQLCQMLDGC